MKVNIVLYENKGWIIDKFASEISGNLDKFAISATISSKPARDADVYHHLIYSNIDRSDFAKFNTALHSVMVTHLDTEKKLEKVLSIGRENNTHLVTMSDYYTDRLVRLGVPKHRVSTVHAPKNESSTSKTKLKLGIFSNYYVDGRKNEQWLISTLGNNPQFSEFIEFLVYGTGWNSTVEKLMSAGFCISVDDNSFDAYQYNKLLDEIDYFLYLGHDEGSMAFLDAISKDKKTIAIPQGFQADFGVFITHPVRNVKDFENVLEEICEKQKKINQLNSYTWSSYTGLLLNTWIKRKQELKYDESLTVRIKSKLLYTFNRITVQKDFGILK